MKLHIVATDKVCELQPGQKARLWKGTTDKGQKCEVFVSLIAVPVGEDQGEFERELDEVRVTQAHVAIPLRLIL